MMGPFVRKGNEYIGECNIVRILVALV